jgi:hypothetical protein
MLFRIENLNKVKLCTANKLSITFAAVKLIIDTHYDCNY